MLGFDPLTSNPSPPRGRGEEFLEQGMRIWEYGVGVGTRKLRNKPTLAPLGERLDGIRRFHQPVPAG